MKLSERPLAPLALVLGKYVAKYVTQCIRFWSNIDLNMQEKQKFLDGNIYDSTPPRQQLSAFKWLTSLHSSSAIVIICCANKTKFFNNESIIRIFYGNIGIFVALLGITSR